MYGDYMWQWVGIPRIASLDQAMAVSNRSALDDHWGYIYIYMHTCIHTHTHNMLYIYIYLYILKCMYIYPKSIRNPQSLSFDFPRVKTGAASQISPRPAMCLVKCIGPARTLDRDGISFGGFHSHGGTLKNRRYDQP